MTDLIKQQLAEHVPGCDCTLFLQLLAFETYRDLVKLLQQNLSEEQGVIAAELQNIEERAAARSAAAAALGMQAGQSSGPTPAATPAGTVLTGTQQAQSGCCVSTTPNEEQDLLLHAGHGEFAAVGFSYGGPADSDVPSRAGDPVEDLGEEASSGSDSGISEIIHDTRPKISFRTAA